MSKKFIYGIVLGVVVGGAVAGVMYRYRINTSQSEAGSVSKWKRDNVNDCIAVYKACKKTNSITVCAGNLDVCLAGTGQNYVGD